MTLISSRCLWLCFGLTIVAAAAWAQEKSAWESEFERCETALLASRFSEAKTCLLAMYSGADMFAPNDVRRPMIFEALGTFYMIEGNFGAAESLYLRAKETWDKVSSSRHPLLAQTLLSLGDLRFEQDRLPEAERLMREALSIDRESLGEKHARTAMAMNHLGALYVTMHRPEAEGLLLQSFAIERSALPLGHPEVAYAMNTLARLYIMQRRYAEAEPLAREALSIAETADPASLSAGAYMTDLGTLYRLEGRPDRADPLLRRALWIFEHSANPEHIRVVPVLTNLAYLRSNEKKFKSAEDFLDRALEITRKSLGAQTANFATLEASRAQIDLAEGNYDHAKPLLEDAFRTEERTLPADDPKLAATLCLLAQVNVREGRHAEAESQYRRAIAIYDNDPAPRRTELANALQDYAGLLKRDRRPEAKAVKGRAQAAFRAAGQ